MCKRPPRLPANDNRSPNGDRRGLDSAAEPGARPGAASVGRPEYRRHRQAAGAGSIRACIDSAPRSRSPECLTPPCRAIEGMTPRPPQRPVARIMAYASLRRRAAGSSGGHASDGLRDALFGPSDCPLPVRDAYLESVSFDDVKLGHANE